MLKRPKKRLVKANAERRAAFVREYALLRAAAQASGAKLLFADLCQLRGYADASIWLALRVRVTSSFGKQRTGQRSA